MTTRSGAVPSTTLVVKRFVGPKTVRAFEAVTSLFVEAGIRAVVPFFDQTSRLEAASMTAPEKAVPKRAVVARLVRADFIRRSAAEPA